MKKILSAIIIASMLLSLNLVNVSADNSKYLSALDPVKTEDFSVKIPYWGFIENAETKAGMFNMTRIGDGASAYVQAKNPQWETAQNVRNICPDSRITDEATICFDMKFSGISSEYDGAISRLVLGDSTMWDQASKVWFFNFDSNFITNTGSTDLTFNGHEILADKWYQYIIEVNFNSRSYKISAENIESGSLTLLKKGTLFGDKIDLFNGINKMQITLESGNDTTLCLDNFKIYDYARSEGKILAPASGATIVGDKGMELAAFAENVDNAWFEINAKKVAEFDSKTSDDIYTCTIPVESLNMGTKSFDMYAYTTTGDIISKNIKFDWSYSGKDNVTAHSVDAWTALWSDNSKNSSLTRTTVAGRDNTNAFNFTYGGAYSTYGKEVKMLYSAAYAHYTGRVCLESDIKLNTNSDMVGMEIGGNSQGTFDIANGSRKAIFCSDGTICNTAVTYEKDQWYGFKYVIDLNLDQAEVYINNNLIKTIPFVGQGEKDTTEISKIHFSIDNKETETPAAGECAGITIDNVKIYEAVFLPKISTVNGSANTNVISKDSNSISLMFDKNLDAIGAVVVKCNDSIVASSAALDSDKKTVSITLNENLLPSSVLNINIASITPEGKTITEESIDTQLYVESLDMAYISPLTLFKTANSNIAFAKYVNGGSAIPSKLWIAEYSDNEKTELVSVTGVDTSIASGNSIVKLSSPQTESVGKATAMLWDENCSPLTNAAE